VLCWCSARSRGYQANRRGNTQERELVNKSGGQGGRSQVDKQPGGQTGDKVERETDKDTVVVSKGQEVVDSGSTSSLSHASRSDSTVGSLSELSLRGDRVAPSKDSTDRGSVAEISIRDGAPSRTRDAADRGSFAEFLRPHIELALGRGFDDNVGRNIVPAVFEVRQHSISWG